MVEGQSGGVVRVQVPAEHIPADHSQGVGQDRYHVGVLLDVLLEGVTHEAPPADIAHPGDEGEKVVGHAHFTRNFWMAPMKMSAWAWEPWTWTWMGSERSMEKRPMMDLPSTR